MFGAAEEVRNLNTYRRWSPYQLEGEITAKVYIPANQIHWVEWWDRSIDPNAPTHRYVNRRFVDPKSLLNFRELF